MKHKMLTHAIVIGCMLSGAAIMAYVDLQRTSLEEPTPVETKKTCTKKLKTSKTVS